MTDIYTAFIVANLIIMVMLWEYDAKSYGRTLLDQVKYDLECLPLPVSLIAVGLFLAIPLSMVYVYYKNYSEGRS